MDVLKYANTLVSIKDIINNRICIEFDNGSDYIKFMDRAVMAGYNALNLSMFNYWVYNKDSEVRERYNGVACVDVSSERVMGFCDRDWYESRHYEILKYKDIKILW
jgi:hypothetical protein